jgi:hypothetical protein
VVICFPFASEIPVGITIATVEPFISVKRGVDAAPGAVLVGSPQSNAAFEVLQRVQAGLGGVTYGILMQATLSDGSTVLVRAVELPVVDF